MKHRLWAVLIIVALPLIASAALPGGLDRSFDSDGKRTFPLAAADGYDVGRAVTMFPDGKILVAVYSGATISVVRLNPNGSHDTAFDGDGVVSVSMTGSATAQDLLVQPDGKIVVAGNDGLNAAVIRLNPNGSLDATFSGDGKFTYTALQGTTMALRMQIDGKLIVAMRVGTFGVDEDFGALRLNSNGSPDTTYDFDGFARFSSASGAVNDTLFAADIEADNKLVLAGRTDAAVPNDAIVVMRVNSNGTLDTSFSTDGIESYNIDSFESLGTVKVLQSGKILIGGTVFGDSFVGRINPNGSLDTTFASVGYRRVDFALPAESFYDLELQSDGKIVAVGGAGNLNGRNFSIARLTENGDIDTTFDGDGKATTDFAGFNDEAASVTIQSNGRIVVSGVASTSATNGDVAIARYHDRRFNVASDFDGDDRTDVSIFRAVPPPLADPEAAPVPSQWWISRSSSTVFAATFGEPTDVIVPGDYTGDGKSDIAFFRPATGSWTILRSEDGSFFAFPFGIGTDIAAPGDYDGDGITDAAVFRPSNSTWYIRNSSGGTTITAFGAAGDRAVPADYDGDGRTDIAIFRPSNGQWWLNRSTAGVIAVTFGLNTDRNVPGDYTGDGKADVALFRPSSGEWIILRSENFSFYSFPFGIGTDKPAPGDYDGDGRFDAAVMRPSNSTWYLNQTTAGVSIIGFGSAGDVPVPGAFVR